MDMRYFTIFDMATVGIPAIAFCIWQLISVNRAIAKDRAAKAAREQSPEDAGHPVGEHRLDDR